MLRNLLGRRPETTEDLRSLYDPAHFNGRKLIESPTSEQGHLLNLQLTTEVSRLDANERLDTLIEIQRELLATQKAILEELRKS